jgi:hypothetical protein
MKTTLHYIQLEEKLNRKATIDNPLLFTYNDVNYKGYRVNGFIYIKYN